MVAKRSLVSLYLVITFGVCWVLALITHFSGGLLHVPWALPVLLVYMAVPALAAAGVQRWGHRQAVMRPLGVRWGWNRWYVAALLAPVLLALTSFGISLLGPGVQLSVGMEGMLSRFESQLSQDQLEQMRTQIASLHPLVILALSLVQGVIAGCTINAVAALGEELGWRGYLVRQWAPMGFWRMSLLIGLIWGIWHAPIIAQGHNYPQHPVIGIGLMTLFCVLLSPIITYIRLRARSVLAAAVFHGVLNGTAGLALLFAAGGSDLTLGVTGWPGLVILAAGNLLLFWHDRRHNEPIGSDPSRLVAMVT